MFCEPDGCVSSETTKCEPLKCKPTYGTFSKDGICRKCTGGVLNCDTNISKGDSCAEGFRRLETDGSCVKCLSPGTKTCDTTGSLKCLEGFAKVSNAC